MAALTDSELKGRLRSAPDECRRNRKSHGGKVNTLEQGASDWIVPVKVKRPKTVLKNTCFEVWLWPLLQHFRSVIGWSVESAT
jgi:hypothetical protein